MHDCMYVDYACLCILSTVQGKSHKPRFCLTSLAKFLLPILINAAITVVQDLSPAFKYSRKRAFLHSWTSPLCVV